MRRCGAASRAAESVAVLDEENQVCAKHRSQATPSLVRRAHRLRGGGVLTEAPPLNPSQSSRDFVIPSVEGPNCSRVSSRGQRTSYSRLRAVVCVCLCARGRVRPVQSMRAHLQQGMDLIAQQRSALDQYGENHGIDLHQVASRTNCVGGLARYRLSHPPLLRDPR